MVVTAPAIIYVVSDLFLARAEHEGAGGQVRSIDIPFSQFRFATPRTSVWQHSGVARGPQTPLWRGMRAAAEVRDRRVVRVKRVECMFAVGWGGFVVIVVVVVECISLMDDV